MTPYYETKLGKLYHGDSLVVLNELPPIELCITDPPYGIDYQSAWRSDKKDWKDKIHGDKKYPMWVFDIKPKNALFVFCRWDNLKEIPMPKSFIVWDKMCHSMGDLNHEFGRQWEGISFYPGDQHEFIHRPVDVIRCPKVPPERLIHPNQKPLGVFYPIIKTHSGVVFDLFVGSGSLPIACERLNRKWIGIEIEEKYCEIAAKRIEGNLTVMERIERSEKGITKKTGLLF